MLLTRFQKRMADLAVRIDLLIFHGNAII